MDIKYIKGDINYIKEMVDVWNDEYGDNHYLKPVTIESYKEKLDSISFFDWDNTILATLNNKVIGFIIYFNMPKLIENKENGAIISQLLVLKEYRNKGIGTKLLNMAIDYFKSFGKIPYNSLVVFS